MDKGTKAMVDMELKAIKLEHCCMGASTPRMVHSTEVVEEYMDEMAIWSTGNGI